MCETNYILLFQNQFKGIGGLPGIMGNPGAPGIPGVDGCNGTDGKKIKTNFLIEYWWFMI